MKIYRFLAIVVLTAMLFAPAAPVQAGNGNEVRICGAQSSFVYGPSWTNDKTFGYYGPYGYFQVLHDKHATERCHTLSTNMSNGNYSVSQVIVYGWLIIPGETSCYGTGISTWSYNDNSQALSFTISGTNTDNVCYFSTYDNTIAYH